MEKIKKIKDLNYNCRRDIGTFKGEVMKDKIIAYLKDETGQTSTEYILLVAVAAAIVIKFKGAITTKLLGNNGQGGLLNAAIDENKILNDLNK